MNIRPISDADAERVLEIYQIGIETGHATFELAAPDWDAFKDKFVAEPRLGIDVDGRLAGWAMLSGVSSRCVYEGVAEISIYMHPDYGRQGLGTRLLDALVQASEGAGYWTLQAGIFPENIASLKLHAACGFRQMGVREKVAKMGHGEMAGDWRDVIMLERRSTVVGID